MNKFIHFHRTPTHRIKMKDIFQIALINSGATSAGNAEQWETISIRITSGENYDDKGYRANEDSYQLNMDRETAERIAKQLNEYLAKKES